MDIRKIRKLIELVKETGIGEIEIHEGEESVRISCQTQPATTFAALPPNTPQAITASPEQIAAPSSAPKPTESVEQQAAANGHSVKSPMVGTAYLSARPGEKPFVEVGQQVHSGDTLCIIEAMKMFNPIEADRDGVISARLIENASPVEYDQPLFIIE